MNRIYIYFIYIFAISMIFFSKQAFTADDGKENEDYDFDIAEAEKKPFQFGGFVEIRPEVSQMNEDAALYKLKFYDKSVSRWEDAYNLKLQLDGSFEYGIAGVYGKGSGNYVRDYDGSLFTGTLYEGYFSLTPAVSLRFNAGKETLKWGKGYAWNPVAFITRPKNPEDPEADLEGYYIIRAEYILSMKGPLKTLSFTPLFLPVKDNLNDDFSPENRHTAAAKLYLLFYDTDIDLIYLSSELKNSRYGLDVSRNIKSNFEIHGEFAYFNKMKRVCITDSGNIGEKKIDALSYLVGLRYLNEWDMTFICEYYHNGTGLNQNEMKVFYDTINNAYDDYILTGDETLIQNKSNRIKKGIGRVNPMTDYLYFRMIRKEPFGILYFQHAISIIYNINDKSFSVSPELLYTGITNLEMRFKAIIFSNKKNSEFGEKAEKKRIELRFRYSF